MKSMRSDKHSTLITDSLGGGYIKLKTKPEQFKVHHYYSGNQRRNPTNDLVQQVISILQVFHDVLYIPLYL